MGDPCESLVREAAKKTRIFSLSKDLWGGALLYIQAAECYRGAGDFKRAYDYAMLAADLLRRYAAKYGHEMVMGDIEKALLVAHSVASGKNKEKIRRELFSTLTLHAKQMEMSGNYLGAADKYRRAIEFAPSGNEAREILQHAIQLLEQTAYETEEELITMPRKFSAKATFRHEDDPAKVASKVPDALKMAGLIPASVDQISTNGDVETRIEASEGNTIARAVFGKSTILISVEGEDSELALDYFITLKNLVLNSANRSKLIEQELEGKMTPFMILKLLNEMKDRCRMKCPYKEISISASSLMKIIEADERLSSEFKSLIKMLKNLMKRLEKMSWKAELIEDEDIPKIISDINEGIEKMKKR